MGERGERGGWVGEVRGEGGERGERGGWVRGEGGEREGFREGG